MCAHTGLRLATSVLTVILLIIPISFSFEITIFSERRQMTFIFSSMYMDLCVRVRAHTHTLTFWSVRFCSLCQGTCVPAEWREATSTHLAYSLLDPSFQEMSSPKEKKKKSLRATGPHGYPPSASAPVYRIHSAEVFQPELNQNCVY